MWKKNSSRSMWTWWTCSLTHLWDWTFHCMVSTGNLVQFKHLCFSRLATFSSCYFCGPGCTKLCNKGCVGKQLLLCVKHLLSLIDISPVANNVSVYVLYSLWKLVIVYLLQLIYYSCKHPTQAYICAMFRHKEIEPFFNPKVRPEHLCLSVE